MIIIKNDSEIALMRKAGKIAAGALRAAGRAVRPGVTTKEIDAVVHDYIVSRGAYPSFLGYNGFAGSACVSVNEQVIHGIPGPLRLSEGDIVKIDVGAYIDGFHGDTADTFPVGAVSQEALWLIETTRESLMQGLAMAVAGSRIGDVGNAVESCVVAKGYTAVRRFVGHGLGRNLHEEPNVPNTGPPGRGARLAKGMTIAVEPMVNQGACDVDILGDGWTVVTADGLLSAHVEHSVAITDGQPEILTLP